MKPSKLFLFAFAALQVTQFIQLWLDVYPTLPLTHCVMWGKLFNPSLP